MLTIEGLISVLGLCLTCHNKISNFQKSIFTIPSITCYSNELTVVVYNINFGHNQELLNACRLLKEYAQYVAQVRTFAKNFPFAEAVEHAVGYCIKNEILSDFLTKNRAEVIAMSIFEYDEEKHMKSEREEWREIGRTEGLQIGLDNLSLLLNSLMNAGKSEEVRHALSDRAYREQLYREYFSKCK